MSRLSYAQSRGFYFVLRVIQRATTLQEKHSNNDKVDDYDKSRAKNGID
jgi:hypothetical protein